jgi:hypothetical protein
VIEYRTAEIATAEEVSKFRRASRQMSRLYDGSIFFINAS